MKLKNEMKFKKRMKILKMKRNKNNKIKLNRN